MWQNVCPVSGDGIWTHDLLNMNRLPQPLDQRSCSSLPFGLSFSFPYLSSSLVFDTFFVLVSIFSICVPIMCLSLALGVSHSHIFLSIRSSQTLTLYLKGPLTLLTVTLWQTIPRHRRSYAYTQVSRHHQTHLDIQTLYLSLSLFP